MAHALASTQSIILGKAALSTFNQGRRVSKKRAHNHLSGMRQQMHANGENWRSLDDDETIRNYVCSRNDAEDVIGDGICAIWGVFLFSPDPNTRLPHVPGRRFDWVLETVDNSAARFDWVLERKDGSAVRIHPGSNSHGVPVYGSLQQWAPPQDGYSAPAATRGEAVKGSGKGGFQGIHQVDVLGRMDAKKFLKACEETWAAQPHPRTVFAKNLMDGTEKAASRGSTRSTSSAGWTPRSSSWRCAARSGPCSHAGPQRAHAPRHAIAMRLACYCHAIAMRLPC